MDLTAAACDPCRKAKKGCDRKKPCGRCRGRGKPEGCTREIARQRLADEMVKKDENKQQDNEKSMEAPNDESRIDIDAEIAANLAAEDSDVPDAAAADDDDGDSIGENSVQYSDRGIPEIDDPHAALHAMYDVASTSSLSSVRSLSSSSSSDSDNDDDNTAVAGEAKIKNKNSDAADAPPAGVMTRKQQEAYDRKKAEKLQAEEYARQPKFVFNMPLALVRWDHKKCDRCRDKNMDCNGETPCDRCVSDNIRKHRPCSTHESEKKYEEAVEEARVKQFDRFEDNREVAEMRALEKRKALAKKKLTLEIKLSEAMDKRRTIKGETLKATIAANKAVERVKELRREREEDEEATGWGEEDEDEMLNRAVKMSLESGEDEEEGEEEGDVEMKEADEEL